MNEAPNSLTNNSTAQKTESGLSTGDSANLGGTNLSGGVSSNNGGRVGNSAIAELINDRFSYPLNEVRKTVTVKVEISKDGTIKQVSATGASQTVENAAISAVKSIDKIPNEYIEGNYPSFTVNLNP